MTKIITADGRSLRLSAGFRPQWMCDEGGGGDAYAVGSQILTGEECYGETERSRESKDTDQ